MYPKRIALLLLSAITFLAFLTSCEEKVQTFPSITLNPDKIEAPEEGGLFSVSYAIENPLSDGKLHFECSETWISDISNDEKDIRFNIAANEEENTRDARIMVIYPDHPEIFISVHQAALDPSKYALNLEVSNVRHSDADIAVTPGDPEMTYLVFYRKTEEMEGLEKDEDLSTYDMNAFETEASASGTDVKDLIAKYIRKGNYQEKVKELYANTAYTAYVYGFDAEEMTRTTDITRVNFQTTDIDPELVTFSIDVEINDMIANLTYDPHGYQQYYVTDVLLLDVTEETEDFEIKNKLIRYWDNMVKFYKDSYNYTNEEIIEECCRKGIFTTEYEIAPDYRFITFAGAVDENLEIISDVEYKWFGE